VICGVWVFCTAALWQNRNFAAGVLAYLCGMDMGFLFNLKVIFLI
jgi:hypothetical protein